ncbi:hypothetical protein H4R99_006236 [Coemansia sp. RSA 1722]|nr:hypothetical protein IWW45_007306 [Coemansia sp. RSA 485]KAJ2592977.1 hypothetical protein H4R99_006236 [Coemansia sp. RSA 1722]
MGPRRGKNLNVIKKAKAIKNAPEPDYTVDQLLEKTKELMDDNKYDRAFKFVVKALEKDENNTHALLLAAIIQLESGEIELATSCLVRCANISPERGFEKYMYLGQLSVELEAVKYFQLGINAIKRDLDEMPQDSEPAAVLRRKVAEAFVAMTEIYLTDCCFEADAENKCEQFLEEGVNIDPGCPEVYQTMASVRLSQNRLDDARDCVSKSMALWADKDVNDPSQIPSYENRLALVRLLLELDDKERALNILERLQKEDDESVDMWYLYGWTYHLQSEENVSADPEDKIELLSSARECFKQAIKLAGLLGFENDGLIDHAQELINAINTVVPISADDDDDADQTKKTNNGADGVEDWDDISSDDDKDVDMGA